MSSYGGSDVKIVGPSLLANWWKTSVNNREQDIQEKISYYNGFTKKEVAYAPTNYFLGNAKCKNCVFFNQENAPCKVITQEPIIGSGLCHFVTSKDPTKPFFIERVYATLPPNATWYIAGGIAAITVTVIVVKALPKGHKAKRPTELKVEVEELDSPES